MGTDLHVLSFVVRFVHVAAMAILVGGSVLVVMMLLAADAQSGTDAPRLPDIVISYEWLAWLAIGLLIMTGVGNLGAFGTAVPPPQTAWGQKLTLKLALVALLVLGSLLRTFLLVLLHSEEGHSRSAPAFATIRIAYAATAGLATVVLLVALALAHG
jgi:putative copper export protein